jgi:ectoine hydroxylase-related dioxygenase (phytanoyl-CoA dioxygenase family)
VHAIGADGGSWSAGLLGPLPLLSASEADALAREIQQDAATVPGLIDRPKGPGYWRKLGIKYAWYKSLHAHAAAARRIAGSPGLISRVRDLLGADVVLWGSQWVEKPPGKAHRWHADVECLDTDGVTVWLPLRNAGPESGIKIVEGSHRLVTYPQALQAEGGLDLEDDDALLAAARRLDPFASIATPQVRPGEFVVFRGSAWHATYNRTAEPRIALIFQFSPRGANVRIPITFAPPLRWHPLPPPVLAL